MKVTSFGRNLKALRDREGITQAQLADMLETTQTTVNGWETRGVQPRRAMQEKIMGIFGLGDDDILSESAGLYAQLHGLVGKPSGAIAAKEPRKAYAPLLGRIHAGDAVEPDVLDDEIPIPWDVWDRHRSGYFLQVEGTCMNRVYPEGCYVFVDPDREPSSGSIAAVSIDGADYIMRRLYVGANTCILSPESFDTEWRDIVITAGSGHEVDMAGTVVWFQPERELR